jgi:AcrR family transcriptional regulator
MISVIEQGTPPRGALQQGTDMGKTTRQRMIETTAVLVRDNGVTDTSFSDVLVASGAPRGSLYHYFPGGKAQLIEEATRYGAGFVVARLAALLEQTDTASAIRRFGEGWGRLVRESDFATGCPLLAAALEGDRHPAARDAAGEGFIQWERLIAAGLGRDGVPAGQALSLATLIVSSLEGGVVLSRAQRTTEPLERVLDQIEHLIQASLKPP